MAFDNEQRFLEKMVKAQRGDKAVYENLLLELSMFLNNYLRPKIFNSDHLDDVIQEILLAVHKSRHTYDSKRSFMSWLLAIVHYKFIDHVRAMAKSDKEFLHSDSNEKDHDYLLEELIKIEVGEQLLLAIESLDEPSRSVIDLLKVQGMKVSEVSIKLNISESNVKVLAHRSIEKLKKIMKPNL